MEVRAPMKLPRLSAQPPRGDIGRNNGDAYGIAEKMTSAVTSLSEMRKRCRTLNEAYEAAEDKAEVRLRLAATLSRLRRIHALLPPRLREKSWVLTMEYCDSWTVKNLSQNS